MSHTTFRNLFKTYDINNKNQYQNYPSSPKSPKSTSYNQPNNLVITKLQISTIK